jgi:hypothetical protein
MIYRPKPNKIGPSRSDARLLDDVENAGKHHERLGIVEVKAAIQVFGLIAMESRSHGLARGDRHFNIQLMQFLDDKWRKARSNFQETPVFIVHPD